MARPIVPPAHGSAELMKTTAMRYASAPLTAHEVAPSHAVQLYKVLVALATALLKRVRRVNTRALTELPAAILEHMHVREWADETRANEARMFDDLVPSTGGSARSQGLHVGSSWQ